LPRGGGGGGGAYNSGKFKSDKLADLAGRGEGENFRETGRHGAQMQSLAELVLLIISIGYGTKKSSLTGWAWWKLRKVGPAAKSLGLSQV